jgi:hypothetical protein
MKRPKGKLFALLAIFAALTLVAASGAFTSVQAERTAQVDVADDANAFLALAPNSSVGNNNGDYATGTAGANNNQLSINLTGANAMGSGVNPNAVTTADHVFNIQNQGTQEVRVYLEVANNAPAGVLTFYHNGTSDLPSDSGSLQGSGNYVTLGTGDKVSVGVKVDTRNYNGGTGSFTEQVTIHAEAA